MKLSHNITASRVVAAEIEIDDRYQVELDRARVKAEKAWRTAVKQRERAERRRQHQRQSIEARNAYEAACREVERRWAELQEIDRLMRSAPVPAANSGTGQVKQRTGRDDHLQLGIATRATANRPKTSTVTTRQEAPKYNCRKCWDKPPAGFICATCGTEGGKK